MWLIDTNPIERVHWETRRMKIPRIITPDQFQKLLDELKEPYRTMVLIAGCLGLRASEVMGLQWQDIDWDKLEIMLERGSVHARLNALKTESPMKSVPMEAEVATALLNHRERLVSVEPTDFILPSPVNEGKPRWQESILENYIRPARYRAGIGKVGWRPRSVDKAQFVSAGWWLIVVVARKQGLWGPVQEGQVWPLRRSGLPFTVKACGCCRSGPEPTCTRTQRLSTDLQAP